MHTTSKIIALSATVVLGLSSITATAEEPYPKSEPTTSDPSRIDRDGKEICGFDVMSESEKAGYKNMMHQTKALPDRDEIRLNHCALMAKRVKDKGLPVAK